MIAISSRNSENDNVCSLETKGYTKAIDLLNMLRKVMIFEDYDELAFYSACKTFTDYYENQFGVQE